MVKEAIETVSNTWLLFKLRKEAEKCDNNAEILLKTTLRWRNAITFSRILLSIFTLGIANLIYYFGQKHNQKTINDWNHPGPVNFFMLNTELYYATKSAIKSLKKHDKNSENSDSNPSNETDNSDVQQEETSSTSSSQEQNTDSAEAKNSEDDETNNIDPEVRKLLSHYADDATAATFHRPTSFLYFTINNELNRFHIIQTAQNKFARDGSPQSAELKLEDKKRITKIALSDDGKLICTINQSGYFNVYKNEAFFKLTHLAKSCIPPMHYGEISEVKFVNNELHFQTSENKEKITVALESYLNQEDNTPPKEESSSSEFSEETTEIISTSLKYKHMEYKPGKYAIIYADKNENKIHIRIDKHVISFTENLDVEKIFPLHFESTEKLFQFTIITLTDGQSGKNNCIMCHTFSNIYNNNNSAHGSLSIRIKNKNNLGELFPLSETLLDKSSSESEFTAFTYHKGTESIYAIKENNKIYKVPVTDTGLNLTRAKARVKSAKLSKGQPVTDIMLSENGKTLIITREDDSLEAYKIHANFMLSKIKKFGQKDTEQTLGKKAYASLRRSHTAIRFNQEQHNAEDFSKAQLK